MARSIKVVFKSSIAGIAQSGDVKEVAAGYARNYLFPRGLAFQATPAALRQWETERQGVVAKQARQRETAQDLAQRLEAIVCTVPAKAGPQGRLFGAIGHREISSILAQQGIQLNKRAIQLAEPLKQLGMFSVPVHINADIQVQLKVNVISEIAAEK